MLKSNGSKVVLCNLDRPSFGASLGRSIRNEQDWNNDSMQNIFAQPKKQERPAEKEPKKKDKRPLKDSDIFSSSLRPQFMVLFSEESYPTKKIHTFIPFISYMRNILIPISVFGLMRMPFVQVSTVMLLEISYMMIIILYRNKIELFDNIIDIFNCCTNTIYILMKFITVFDIDDSTRQNRLGKVMVVVLVVNFIGNMAYVFYSLYLIFKGIGLMVVKRCKKSKEQRRVDDSMSRWKEIIIFEFTIQPQESNDISVIAPVVVVEPPEVVNDIQVVTPRPIEVDPPVPKKNRVVNVPGLRVNALPGRMKKVNVAELHKNKVIKRERERR